MPEDAVVRLHDGVADPKLLPTRSNLLRVLATLPRMVPEPVDTLFFFFSGHGFHSPADDSDYLLLADSFKEALEETSARFELVLRLLRGVGAKHVLIFLDACRSVRTGGKGLSSAPDLAPAEDLSPPGMVSFCSCEPGEVSYEPDELGGGIFTAVVREALSEAGRCVTVEDLNRYLTTGIPALSRRSGKPVQRAHTRVEPLSLKDLEIVAPAVRASWHTVDPVGSELRPAGPGAGTIATVEDPMVAIDFGTTYSAIAVPDRDGVVHLVPGDDGRVLIPSVVSFTEGFDYVVGARAVVLGSHRPGTTVTNVKRQIGVDRLVRVGERSMPPELVASFILRSLRENASAATGREVRRCVTAYPANFTMRQVNALQQAFQLAGFEVMRMIGEPNIATLLLARDWPSFEGNVLVIDLGGGTLDVAYAESGEGVSEIRSAAGNNELGGLDYDEAILGVIRRRLTAAHDGLVIGDLMLAEIRREAERVKRMLTARDDAVAVVRDVPAENGLEDLQLTITRDEVRAAVAHLDAEVRRVVQAALERPDGKGKWGRESPNGIDLVMFSGLGGKMFTVREAVRAVGVHAPFVDQYQELGVVRGLAEQVKVLTGQSKRTLLLDLVHRGIGFRAVGGGRAFRKDGRDSDGVAILLDGLTTIPTKRSPEPVQFTGAAYDPVTLVLVERSRVDNEYVEIGTVRFPAPGASVDLAFTLDVDANSIIVLRIEDRTNRVLRSYQLNQHYRGLVFGQPLPGERFELLAEGWRLRPTRQIELDGVTDEGSVEEAGETSASVDMEDLLAVVAANSSATAYGRALTRVGRTAEALSVLAAELNHDTAVADLKLEALCTATCEVLELVQPRYREPGVDLVVGRLRRVGQRGGKHDQVIRRCIERLRKVGRYRSVEALASELKKQGRTTKPLEEQRRDRIYVDVL